MAWQPYVDSMLLAKALPDGSVIGDANEHGAILGLDGTVWAASPGFELKDYDFDLVVDEDTKKKVHVNELKNVQECKQLSLSFLLFPYFNT